MSDGLMWWFLKIRWEVEDKLAKVSDDSDKVSDKKKWPSFVSVLCIKCTTGYKSIQSSQWKRLVIILHRGSELSNSLFCTLHCTCKHLTDTALALANLKIFNNKSLPFVMWWCWLPFHSCLNSYRISNRETLVEKEVTLVKRLWGSNGSPHW